MDVETLAHITIDSAYKIHSELGSGLLESVYEAILAKRLEQLGVRTQRQKAIPFELDGVTFGVGFRADLLVEEKLLVELKSIEQITPSHFKTVLTYIRLLKLPLGILINFGAATFKQGVRRVVNNHTEFNSSTLRLHHQAHAAQDER